MHTHTPLLNFVNFFLIFLFFEPLQVPIITPAQLEVLSLDYQVTIQLNLFSIYLCHPSIHFYTQLNNKSIHYVLFNYYLVE